MTEGATSGTTQPQQPQQAQRQPTLEDIFNMVQKKTGVDFAQDPTELAGKRLESEIGAAFKKVFPGKSITDLANLTKQERAHWDAVVHKVKTQYETEAKDKHKNALELFKTYSSLYEKDLHNQLKALELENKQLKAGEASKTDYQVTRDSLKQRGLPYDDTAVDKDMEAKKTRVAQAARSVFGIVPDKATGAYFDKTAKKWFINTDSGKVELNSEQIKNLGLQAKEEATASDIKSMQQSAPAVLDFTKKLKKQITDAEKGLGPMASRWREFTQGKIGLEDPAFAAMKTNIDLMVTRLMKMHVGARGSEYIMKEFKNMVDFGKQSPKNLMASLEQIEDYANEATKGRIPKLYEQVLTGTPAGGVNVPPKNQKGWVLHIDANGNKAYINPKNKNDYEEVK